VSSGNLLKRLGPAIGKPAATVFVEGGTDRHLILEFTFSAVVGYLAGKFLDGFVEGLGVNDLGKRVGRKVREAVTRLATLIVQAEGTPEQELELQTYWEVLGNVASILSVSATDPVPRARGENAVAEALLEKGLPPAEARRIATRIGVQLFLTAPPPGSNG
jgi:hypothetical protein